MRVAVTTIYDASSVDRWRRVGSWACEALADQGLDLVHLGPLQLRRPWVTAPKKLLYNHLVPPRPASRYHPGRDRLVVKDFSAQLRTKLSGVDADAIFSAESPWSQPIAYLDTDLPMLMWIDTTFAGVIDFYPSYTGLSRSTVRDGMRNEENALRRAAMVVFSSDWAATRAQEIYGLAAAKTRVVPYGPAARVTESDGDVATAVDARPRDRCRLLFMAENWERKGGAVAVAVADGLNRAGLPTTLTVAGCTPPPEAAGLSWLDAVGFIDKSAPGGETRFRDLMRSTHFLVLPTRADCTPLVFSEAAAYGVPCLSTDVGGITSVIREGINGTTFPLDADPVEWVNFVLGRFGDADAYRSLAIGSRQEYSRRLNWVSAGREVAALIRGLRT